VFRLFFIPQVMQSVETFVSAHEYAHLSDDFYRNFLIGIGLTGEDGRVVYTRKDVRTFCRREKSDGRCPVCEEENVFAANEALRFGDTYVMNAHTGLIFFALPLMVNQRVIGGIVSSRILPLELYTLITEERAASSRHHDEYIVSSVKSIPVIETRTITLAAEYLWTLAVRHNLINQSRLARQRDIHERESDRAEAISANKMLPENYHRLYLYKERDLSEKIKNGDKHGAVRILNEILIGIFGSSRTPIDIIKVRLMELVVVISRAAVEAGVDSRMLFGLNYSYFRDIAAIHNEVDLSHWIVTVLENYIREVARHHAAFPRNSRIRSVFEYVGAHYKEKVSLADVASLVGLSPSHFAHEFKKETGVSFITFFNEFKLQKAVDLLVATDESIVNIAYEMGYSDESYFIKQFRRKYRMTPLEYRKKYQRNLGAGSLAGTNRP
jgi:two-component system response regulator YesN